VETDLISLEKLLHALFSSNLTPSDMYLPFGAYNCPPYNCPPHRHPLKKRKLQLFLLHQFKIPKKKEKTKFGYQEFRESVNHKENFH
jgi:hypothetical protein